MFTRSMWFRLLPTAVGLAFLVGCGVGFETVTPATDDMPDVQGPEGEEPTLPDDDEGVAPDEPMGGDGAFDER